MENASKALLIAGAILLVIAIIAIGMAILGMGESTVEDVASNMGGLSVQAYNAKITPYLDKELSKREFNDLKAIAKNMGIDMTAARYDTLGASAPSDAQKNNIAIAVDYYEDGKIKNIEFNGTKYGPTK